MVTDDKATAINALINAVEAIEHELGIIPSGSYADVRARLDIIEARINNPLAPSPTVVNPFFIGNSGVSISVGSGAPSSVVTNGSLYLRTDGTSLQGLYSYRNIIGWSQIDTTPFIANGDLSGTNQNQKVIGLQTHPVSNAVPSDGYVLTYSAAAGQWQPQIVVTGGSGTPTGAASGDLSGLYPSPAVAKINGSSVPSNPAANTVLVSLGGNTLTYLQLTNSYISNSAAITGSKITSATNSNLGVIELSGDLGGTATSPSVVNINGATVPASGSLTTGNVLQVTGTSTLSYSAINLAGGANYVTGLLPIGNQANQAMGGDVSGTTNSTTVIKLQAHAVSSTAPTDGYVLTWVAGNNDWEPKPSAISFTAGGDLSGTNINQQVISITGLGGTLNVSSTAAIINWSNSTTSPTLKQADNITNSATAQSLTIQAQNATGTTSTGGNLVLKSGTGTSNIGTISLVAGATTIASVISTKFVQNKGWRRNVTSVNHSASPYTILTTDNILSVTTTGGVVTLNLPTLPTTGDIYEVKDSGGVAATNNITISGNGNTIDSLSTYPVDQNYSGLTLFYNGTEWSVL